MSGPELVLGATPQDLVPERDSLAVGYYEPGLAGQLPLVVAQLSGYFEDAGFQDVTLVETKSAQRDVQDGGLDFAVAPARSSFKAWYDDPQAPAIAGYRNYDGNGGAFGGDLLLAAPGLVEHEPATVIAFLGAYIRALQDLSDPETAADALALIEASDLAVPSTLVSDWEDELAAFAPFDGGFGSYADAGGYGELLEYLARRRKQEASFDDFVADHTLNIAQASVGLHPNPDAGFVGPPSITQISVGVPASADGSVDPVQIAEREGYFTDAGFESVQIMDIEEPLLGLLNNQLDFAVVDTVDAADGASQGLPAVAIAGHRNYGPDGAYGGDVMLTTSDLVEVDRSTASAFLIAYLRALQDLAPDTAAFAPFDGGFGAAADGGGTGELDTYLSDELGGSPDVDALIDPRTLEFAQAWWGLPANPTSVEVPASGGTAPQEEAP